MVRIDSEILSALVVNYKRFFGHLDEPENTRALHYNKKHPYLIIICFDASVALPYSTLENQCTLWAELPRDSRNVRK